MAEVEIKNEEALKEFLKMIAEHPELADRITVTIKPQKVLSQSQKPKE